MYYYSRVQSLAELFLVVLTLSEDYILSSESQQISPVRRVSSFALTQDTEERKLPNVIVAKNLNLASRKIQIQVLEVCRYHSSIYHLAHMEIAHPDKTYVYA